jgi:branched-chain amino acid transport system substrate-binding protein
MNSELRTYILEQKLTSIGFLGFNNDTGRGGIQGLQADLPPTVKTAYVGYFNYGEVDFSSHVSNLRNSGAQAVLLLMDEEPGALAIRQIRDAGLEIKLIGTLAMGSNRFLDRLNAKYVAGMAQVSAFPPSADIPRIKTFNDAYKARFNEESHGFAAQSYDALMLAVAAMRDAGTTTDTTAIRDQLSREKYDGVIGTIQFDVHGQAHPPVYMTEWCDNGTRKIIAPPDLVSACGGG